VAPFHFRKLVGAFPNTRLISSNSDISTAA
jgi:hypothetical protein